MIVRYLKSLAAVMGWVAFIQLWLPALAIADEKTPEAVMETAKKPDLPLEELQLFADVFELIRNNYVEDIKDKQLIELAIKGMLEGLDPHSAYLEADDFDHLQRNTSGAFGGVGIEIDMQDGLIRVVAPMDDTPAANAGIIAGDLIFELDGKPVKGMTLRDAVEYLRGKPGSAVKLGVFREGEKNPLRFTLERDRIKVTSVRHRIEDERYGYVRISQFQENTAEDVREAIESLREEGAKGLILDLRNNPGGVLEAAVSVSDAFLSQGVIVSTQGRTKASVVTFNARVANTLAGQMPTVVLINAGSASASEIVAGALQDHKRALIIGTPSFGKGSVQTVLPLKTEIALKLTTARYYTPKGRSIQAEGIEPDILVNQGTFRATDNEANHYKERDLSRHLDNEKDAKADTEDTKKRAKMRRDFQLAQALTVLKGIVLSQKP